MKNVKDALLRMVSAGRKMERLMEAYVDVGLNDTMLHEAYGEIGEAIYDLVGEHTDEFAESVTYTALTAPILSNERRTEILFAEYKKNNGLVCQPSPVITERKEMKELYKKNGGYMFDSPEGG